MYGRQKFGRSETEESDDYLSVKVMIIDDSGVRKELINRVENMTASILRQIVNEEFPKIDNVSSNSYIAFNTNDEENDVMDTCPCEVDSESEDEGDFDGTIEIESNDCEGKKGPTFQKSFIPNSNSVISYLDEKGRLQMTLLMVILARAHNLLICDSYQTKRALYYELKGEGLVEKQNTVDVLVNKIASLVQCSTWDLGFIATAKGLVSGDVKLTLDDGTEIDCNTMGGVLIPQANSKVILIKSKVSFILVVEKDAVFQKLLVENCSSQLNCLLITGKGYPDVATRIFLKMLIEYLKVPAYILVDADPHGIDIMCVYKYGSAALEWEKASLICSAIQWIGVAPSEIFGLNLKTHPLSPIDNQKLESLEKKSFISEQLRREFEIMRQGKVGIEAVSSIAPTFLTSIYLPCKIPNLAQQEKDQFSVHSSIQE